MASPRLGGLLPREPVLRDETPAKTRAAPLAGGTSTSRAGFGLLIAIGMPDNAARPAFLVYLPFLLQEKGAALATVGVAFAFLAVGGAPGKAVFGRFGERFGVTRSVIFTVAGTAAAILLVIALPPAPTLAVLPLLAMMLNGTSSVLYGMVPEPAPHGRVERAFAVFYTWTLGGTALATPLPYGPLGDGAGPGWEAVAALVTALAVVPIKLRLSPHRATGR